MTTNDDSTTFCEQCRGPCAGPDTHDGVMPILLSEPDHAVARLLGAGMTYTEAGQHLGMSEATVYRRMQSENLRRAVDIERSVHVDRIASRLTEAGSDAVAALVEVATDVEAPPNARIRAADSILTQLARLRTWHQDRPRVPDRQHEAKIALLFPDSLDPF